MDDLRRRVAALIVVRASGHLDDQQRRYPRWELSNSELKQLLADGVGGVILLGGSAIELQQRTRQLQGWSDQALLFCADVEEGVGQRFEGASWLVPARENMNPGTFGRRCPTFRAPQRNRSKVPKSFFSGELCRFRALNDIF